MATIGGDAMMPEQTQREQEAMARQCLAETVAASALHHHAGPDRRELVLNALVESALHTYEGYRRLELLTCHRSAEGAADFVPSLHAGLQRTARLHLDLGRALIDQLDAASLDRLTVRNALAFRQAYADLVALEAMDHGPVPAGIVTLAEAAALAHRAGNTQEIDPERPRGEGVTSFRTWDFIKRTAQLPPDMQGLAAKRYRRFFAVDDRHPALGGRPLFAGRGAQPLWSVQIGFSYRALALLDEGHAGDGRDDDEHAGLARCYIWFWIGGAADYLCGGSAAGS